MISHNDFVMTTAARTLFWLLLPSLLLLYHNIYKVKQQLLRSQNKLNNVQAAWTEQKWWAGQVMSRSLLETNQFASSDLSPTADQHIASQFHGLSYYSVTISNIHKITVHKIQHTALVWLLISIAYMHIWWYYYHCLVLFNWPNLKPKIFMPLNTVCPIPNCT